MYGYWILTYNEIDAGFGELNDLDKEHIASMIINGYNEGELDHDDEPEGG